MLELKKSIESHYVTSYGAEISEVFCHIFERNINLSPIQDFFNSISKFSFFDTEKFNQDFFNKLGLSNAKSIMISAIIKEAKYNEHFMSWEKGEEYLNFYLNELNGVEKIYTNSYWDESTSYENECDLIGWSGISKSYWYDYGFIVVTENKIGVLWFGDDS